MAASSSLLDADTSNSLHSVAYRNCMIHSWYAKLKPYTLQTFFVKLPSEYVEYLDNGVSFAQSLQELLT